MCNVSKETWASGKERDREGERQREPVTRDREKMVGGNNEESECARNRKLGRKRAWKDTERRVDWERGRGTHGRRSSRRRRRKGRGPAVLL